MGLALNLIVQTIAWFGLMGAVIFGAAGTIDYAGGWLYLGGMIAISVVGGLHLARVDPGLLRERLKPPIQKDQPLADKLILIPSCSSCSAAWGSWRPTPRAGAGRLRHPLCNGQDACSSSRQFCSRTGRCTRTLLRRRW
jgi:hypothetical protein